MPEYTQKFMLDFFKPGKLSLLSSPEGKGWVFKMDLDVLLYMDNLFDNQEIEDPLELKKHAWMQIVSGELY